MKWDIVVRGCHWLSASLFILAYFYLEEGELAHRWAGYVVFGSTVIRVVWGFIGSQYARFTHFIPTPAKIKTHLLDIFHRRLVLEKGHNPLGASMAFFLLLGLMSTAVTGWLQTLDFFWGNELMEIMHEWAAKLTLWAACVHVAALLLMSYFYRHNLIKRMI